LEVNSSSGNKRPAAIASISAQQAARSAVLSSRRDGYNCSLPHSIPKEAVMKTRITLGTAVLLALLVGWLSAQTVAPAPTQPAAQPGPPSGFAIEQFTLRNKNIIYLRVNRSTGMAQVSFGDDWQKLPEKGTAPPQGDYQVLLAQDPDDGDFAAIRFDRSSGKTWVLDSLAWLEMKEPQ
jgi:hypothetical protein